MGWTVYNSDGKVLQSAELGDNSVTSAKIADGAIVNADINASAAIAKTKLASLDVVNADVNASAAIAFSKMANLTTSRALVSDGNGDVSVSAVTSTEIGYLDGVTSAIQTQLNAAGGATTREGGNTTEATTTSTSAVDTVSITSLNIEEANYISGKSLHRKSTGAVGDAGGGLKLNSTVFAEAVDSGSIGLRLTGVMVTTDGNFSGISDWSIPATGTNYTFGGATGASNFGGGTYVTHAGTSDRPTANITSVTLRGITLSSSNTWGHDEVHVYSWANS